LDVEPSAFCLEVARAEAGRLAPLVDELRKKAGLERAVRSQQAGQFEELRWASDLVFDSMRDLFFHMVQNAYEQREGGLDGSRRRPPLRPVGGPKSGSRISDQPAGQISDDSSL